MPATAWTTTSNEARKNPKSNAVGLTLDGRYAATARAGEIADTAMQTKRKTRKRRTADVRAKPPRY